MKSGPPSPASVLDVADHDVPLSDAAAAFDTIAQEFDTRYSEWASVAAQRRAVRRWLERTLPAHGTLLELGAGTGEDAVYLASRGYRIVATDPSPGMVDAARRKSEAHGLTDRLITERADAARLEQHADRWFASRIAPFDGAYSNFAALNCLGDLTPVARGLAHVLRPGAVAGVVLFGPFAPGEVIVQVARGKPRAALRRVRHVAPARLGGRHFSVWYHRPRNVARAFAPWFRLERRVGIGLFVPPSAAEPWISRHPKFLDRLEQLDRISERLLPLFGDHVLYVFRRTDSFHAAL